ncbi:MAG: response regulator [Mariprofundaceae bacterium]|nr:response regulator [Mariprofundaceae bacterium]
MSCVLVVDDQSILREVIADLLREFEMADEVFEAKNLKVACSIMQEQQLIGIVTDMNLADGNMLDLIANMQQNGYTLPPTVLLSGFLSEKSIRRAKELGIKVVLDKPLRPDILLEKIEKLLMHHKDLDAAGL